MLSIQACPLPDGAFLSKYASSGAYTDCFATELAGEVAHAQYVQAFYTTAVFKLERLILQWAIAKPSTDEQARQLAAGKIDAFAAWRTEDRSENQLLMCDIHGRTRSWLMVAPAANNGASRTRLYFGSAVVPVENRKTGERKMGSGFSALIGFHKVYSVILLYAARSRLERNSA